MAPQSISVGGYQVNSQEEISLEQETGLVRGDGLTVVGAQGQVLYEQLRAFLPINSKRHLIRLADGLWVLLILKDKPKQCSLKKVNLRFKDIVMMFDERGKRHPNQVSPYYRDITC